MTLTSRVHVRRPRNCRPTPANARKAKEKRRLELGLEVPRQKTIEELLEETKPLAQVIRELVGELGAPGDDA
mgnify:CR=1 FL=1